MDMQSTDIKNETDKVCIIGAGSSGLAVAKTFAERGIPFDCLEREDDDKLGPFAGLPPAADRTLGAR
jgi:2-polyprenyl-6-methoxyphenol hydroxylase-like FAD-dependent oxidoreductase